MLKAILRGTSSVVTTMPQRKEFAFIRRLTIFRLGTTAALGLCTMNWSVPRSRFFEMLPSAALTRSCYLFGGKLEVQAQNGLVIVEGWVRLAANARIRALIGGVRKKIDELLTRKVEDPRFDICSTTEMKLIRSLLMTDGMGQ